MASTHHNRTFCKAKCGQDSKTGGTILRHNIREWVCSLLDLVHRTSNPPQAITHAFLIEKRSSRLKVLYHFRTLGTMGKKKHQALLTERQPSHPGLSCRVYHAALFSVM